MVDAEKVTSAFEGIPVDRVLSSPFKRAVDTVVPFAESRGIGIGLIEDFRERRSDSVQTIPMEELIRKQWKDFAYTLSDGECLGEVQERNIRALNTVLEDNRGKSVVIGTHGMALCTMIRYFRPGIRIAEVEEIMDKLPYLLLMEFSGSEFIGMNELKFDFS